MWTLDQLTKSEFFHQKLHQWGVLEVALEIDQVQGEGYDWDREALGISRKAWGRVIHRGIKPVTVFAHPQVLTHIQRATGYYRMLAMVSQKSMGRVGLPGNRYEGGKETPSLEAAEQIARHLNKIISRLIEADEQINPREFDLWRGMAAGSQAQGSWQNTKGDRVAVTVRGVFLRRLGHGGLIIEEEPSPSVVELSDGRKVIFSDEPDIAFYKGGRIAAAIEVKGGIDTAGVLERVGAAIKSLRRVKEQTPESVTILILQGVSMTDQAREDLLTNRQVVNRWFTVEELLGNDQAQVELFDLLGI
ncbi:MAG: XcyI family restriction endonuclease [Anaerolineae bacterium]